MRRSECCSTGNMKHGKCPVNAELTGARDEMPCTSVSSHARFQSVALCHDGSKRGSTQNCAEDGERDGRQPADTILGEKTRCRGGKASAQGDPAQRNGADEAGESHHVWQQSRKPRRLWKDHQSEDQCLRVEERREKAQRLPRSGRSVARKDRSRAKGQGLTIRGRGKPRCAGQRQG